MNPDIVHVNFGIHDASIQNDGEHQILLSQYRLCLQRFITKVKELNKIKMIWAGARLRKSKRLLDGKQLNFNQLTF